jgi:plasmid replication initiation protein
MARKREQDSQLDFFVAYAGDVPLRDDREAMSLPLVSLAKKKRVSPIEWQSPDGAAWVKVTCSPEYGMATIYDLDIILWAVSQLNEAVERGSETSPVLSFYPYDLLKAIRRDVGGRNYELLKEALTRLRNTTIKTNIRTTGRKKEAVFGWLEGWHAEEDEATGQSKGMRIILPHWLYQAVVKERTVLAVSPEYFELTSGLARWLYRLARRHAGKQATGWRFTLRHLWERSGTTQRFGDFARDVRKVVEADGLPEYRVQLLEGQHGDEVVWMVRDPARCGLPQRRELQNIRLPPHAE